MSHTMSYNDDSAWQLKAVERFYRMDVSQKYVYCGSKKKQLSQNQILWFLKGEEWTGLL